MRYLYALVLMTLIVLWSSCRKDFDADPSTGNLQFSTDTLFLDTVFTNIGSSTYSFKVYNRTDKDLNIPRIVLEKGESSDYRLNVDGIAGQVFEDIQVLANDSIFVFVETTTDISNQTQDVALLSTDRILFDPNGNTQDVDLVTLVQDAVFLFPSRDNSTGVVESLVIGEDENMQEVRVQGFLLNDDELVFTNEKPYVIFGFAAIPPDKTLTIEAGARVHFHEGSGIIASNRSTLIIDGALSTDPEALENEVIFESDRLEPDFSDIAGQWGAIWLTAGSTGHRINHTTIKNATFGIIMDSFAEENTPTLSSTDPILTISNTQIYNISNFGILGRTTSITGENVVINNCGISSLYCSFGGVYNFNHSTFANYWNSSFRDTPAVQIDNAFVVRDNGIIIETLTQDLTAANFINCIIYGNESIELGITQIEGTAFSFNFKNSLIRFNDFSGRFKEDPLFDFSNTSLYENTLFNENPGFKAPTENELNIDEESAANGTAATPGSGNDILGTARSATEPDMGAYESTTFETDEDSKQ